MKHLPRLLLLVALLALAGTASAAPQLGLQAWTFRDLTLAQTLEQAHQLGIDRLQAYPGQKIGADIPGVFDASLDAASLKRVLKLAKASRVKIVSFGVTTPADNAGWDQLFAFARAAGLKEIVTEATPETLAALAPKVKAAGLTLSLHNHPQPSRYALPETALAALAGLDARYFGLCADTGHWARTGLDPVAALKQAAGRVHSLHLKDIAERGRDSRDVPWGTGTSDLALQLAELRRQGFDGVAYIEYEHQSSALVAEVARCVAYFKAALAASTDDLVRNRVAPPGFSSDVHAVFAGSRGRDSARWPQPQPLFAPDLSNAELAYPGAWKFSADGVLAPQPAGGRKPGDLWTKELYGDFVLSLDFRAQENANSGVFLRGTDIVNWLQNSIEIQILQGESHRLINATGAVYDVAAPTRAVPITPGEWYRYVITARGSKLTVTLNGEELTKADLDQWTRPGFNPDGTPNKFTKAYKDMARVGRIGLQYHDTPIEFRHLLVERIETPAKP